MPQVDYKEIVALIPLDYKNLDGRRGFYKGILVFDCPLCGDNKGRGWISLARARGGCFRSSCVASGSLPAKFYFDTLFIHGVIDEKARDAATLLFCELPRRFVTNREKPKRIQPWVKITGKVRELRHYDIPPSWSSLDVSVLHDFGFAYISNDYGHGILIPVLMHFRLCYFVIRYSSGDYIAAREHEAGHKKSQVLFGYDLVPKESTVVIVESAQDAVAVITRFGVPAVALLGSSMSEEQKLLLLEKEPRSVIVALDLDAYKKSLEMASDLVQLFPSVSVGTWKYAKDAASGGVLVLDS